MESATEDTTATDIEQTVQIEMQRMISTLSTSDPGTAAMLRFNGLDNVIATSSLQDVVSHIQHRWIHLEEIHLEENAAINVEEDEAVDDDDATPEEPLDPAERVVLQRNDCTSSHVPQRWGKVRRFCCLGFLYGSL